LQFTAGNTSRVGPSAVPQLLSGTARRLVEQLDGATACVISRVIGDLLVDLTQHSTSGRVDSGHEYLVSDFPLTRQVIESGEPEVVLLSDPDADQAEADLLRLIGFESLLMLPLETTGSCWGLLEVYGDERGFSAADVEAAREVAADTGRKLEELA
jgi:transcriptional regulator with GAF, ATPase, and Fis domain